MTNNTAMQSEFAPAECLDTKEINRQAKMVAEVPYLCKHFDAIPSIVFILNEQRQIVFANQAAVSKFKTKNREDLYGLRLGKTINCIHAGESHTRCGTTLFCRECGAVKAILTGLEGNSTVAESRIATNGQENDLDFRVTSSPYSIGKESFVIFVLVDISSEKRHEVLERIFFHDIKNTAGFLTNYVELLKMDLASENNEMLENISITANMLVSEIKAQEQLLLAEAGNLPIHPTELNALEILREIVSIYKQHSCAKSKHIQLDAAAVDHIFNSDKTQVLRIIGNMLKNALEASSENDTVKAGCALTNDRQIRFWVWNSHYIPENVQLQIFYRSFSTKGVGRGIGTYSMKLLGEKYLKGTVGFTSEQQAGTTFFLILPLS